MPRSVTLVVLFALWSGAAPAVDSHDTLLLAQPDINERNITFIYDGDVWVANRDGSGAYRLTTAEGQESLPHFSPDGASIAFSGNYDGNIDVYVVPIGGGSPKRLTWHSADDLVEGFDHRGRVVFSSQSDVQTARDVHLFAIDPTAALPERLPIPRGIDADISPDGRTIAYAQTPPQTQWKNVSRRHRVAHRDHELHGPRAEAGSAAAESLQRRQPDVDRRQGLLRLRP